MKIGDIEAGRIFLAPMAGVTDLAYRVICRGYGATLAFSEMVSAKALSYNDKKTLSLLNFDGERPPRAAQLFGREPELIAAAAERLSGAVEIIDINMGCPAPKITRNGEGSALLRDPALVGRIVGAAVKSARVPVTVKIRAGYDSVNAAEIARIIEANGAAAITVHGRTAVQQFSGAADREIIKSVKDAVKIPVAGNGDIRSAADAAAMLEETECDAVMIGRGALGNPFIFREISELLETGAVKAGASLEEKCRTAALHVERLIALKGEHIGVLEARRHIAWYVKGIKGASDIKTAANSAKTHEELKKLLEGLLTRA